MQSSSPYVSSLLCCEQHMGAAGLFTTAAIQTVERRSRKLLCFALNKRKKLIA